MLSRADNPLVRAVARVPTTVHRKLLVAFAAIVVLLVTVGALGVRVLGDSNNRIEALGSAENRLVDYEPLQQDNSQLRQVLGLRTTSDVNRFASGIPILSPASVAIVDADIDYILGVQDQDLAKINFVPTPPEKQLLDKLRARYASFAGSMTQIEKDDQAGNTSAGQDRQAREAAPIARDIEVLTAQLVNTTVQDSLSLIDQNRSAYADSQHLFIAFAAGSIVLALLLGFVLSWSIVGPIRRMNTPLPRSPQGISRATSTSPTATSWARLQPTSTR
jgi:hypothetical protein